MAIYKPATNGSWNTVQWQSVNDATQSQASWANASGAPTINDEVWLDGKTLTINPNIIVSASRIIATRIPNESGFAYTAGLPGGVYGAVSSSLVGGKLQITSSGTYYITASYITGPGTSQNNAVLDITAAASSSIVYVSASINANASGDGANTTRIVSVAANTCSLFINGNLYGGYYTTAVAIVNTNIAAQPAGRSILILTGSAYGAAGTTAIGNTCIYIASTLATCSISGSVINNGLNPTILMVSSRSLVEVRAGSVVSSINAPAISGSMSAPLSQSIFISGNIVNHPKTGQQAIYTANRVYIHSSSLGSSCKIQIKPYPAGNVELVDPNFGTVITYPAENNVVSGYAYGNGQTGTMRTPLPRDVRNEITYTTASRVTSATTSTWQVLQVQGACYMPHSSSVRVGVSYDSASTPGAMLVPSQSQTQWGAFFSTSSLTGSYQSASQYWSTSSNSFTQVSSSVYLLSRSLDVALGTITGSFVANLNDVNATSNTVRRMQNVHTTQSVSQSIGAYGSL
jgi:hypothetical protein